MLPMLAVKKRKYWLLAIVTVILIALGIYGYYKYSFINKQVSKTVAQQTDSLYKITYDSIFVDEVAGKLFVKNLHFFGDTIVQRKMIDRGDTMAASSLFDVFVPSLEVTGFDAVTALAGSQLSCSKITIMDPKVTVHVYPEVPDRSDKKYGALRWYDLLPKGYKLVQADTVSIINSEIVAVNTDTKKINFHTFNTSLILEKVLLDSAHFYDTSRTLFSKKVGFHTDKITIGNNPVLADVTNVTFETDKKILAISRINKDKTKDGGQLTGLVKDIVITDFQIRGGLNALNIVVGDAKVDHLQLQFAKKGSAGNKTKESETGLLTDWIKSFALKDLKVNDMILQSTGEKGEENKYKLSNTRISISDLVLDKSSLLNSDLLKKAGNVELRADEISFASHDKMYRYSFSGIHTSLAKKTIRFKKISIKPTLGEKAFADKAGVQKDRYNVQFKNLLASQVNFIKMAEGNIDISKITTSGSKVDIYRDNTRRSDSVKKNGRFPHQLVYKLSIPIAIKKIELSNTHISYREKSPLSGQIGNLYFEKSFISISNITNAPNSADRFTDIDVKARLLGQIPLNIQIKFDLHNVKEGRFKVSGIAKQAFNGKLLNPITEPLGPIRIDKGNINYLEFAFDGDNNIAMGDLVVKYNDLKISLLKKGKNDTALSKKHLISFAANFLVKNDNPANGKLRNASVEYKRDEYKSFFNMIWKFVFTGLKDVMKTKI